MAFVGLVFLVCASIMMGFAPHVAYAAQVRVNWFSTHLFSTLSLLSVRSLSLSGWLLCPKERVCRVKRLYHRDGDSSYDRGIQILIGFAIFQLRV